MRGWTPWGAVADTTQPSPYPTPYLRHEQSMAMDPG
jgi:hypothetical protein